MAREENNDPNISINVIENHIKFQISCYRNIENEHKHRRLEESWR